MMNYIWAALVLISITAGAVTGKLDAVTESVIVSSGEAVTLVIGLLGIMCFWTGIMKVAERSGLVGIIARLISPVTGFLFPEVPPESKAMGAMTMNMVANMMGLANAATPLGVSAMAELSKLNSNNKTASRAMCMFVVINTASIQLIPTTMIALRAQAGSANPFEIIVPGWIASAAALITAVAIARLCERKGSEK